MSNDYEKIKKEQGLKEYIFFTEAGYRKFIVLGKDLKDAEENFMRINPFRRGHFEIEHLPVRLEYDDVKCKGWSWDKFLDNNEVKKNIDSNN